mmetsp:Transcript_5836/g.15205  ORF Transcript_5836/g.15205 Transcript_5836/m.15205 type:complete len:83 (-) Transcript_5836:540-788(-)
MHPGTLYNNTTYVLERRATGCPILRYPTRHTGTNDSVSQHSLCAVYTTRAVRALGYNKSKSSSLSLYFMIVLLILDVSTHVM